MRELENENQVDSLFDTYNKTRNPNKLQRKRGNEIPPRLLGYYPYSAFQSK
jgi:hypothetical protein